MKQKHIWGIVVAAGILAAVGFAFSPWQVGGQSLTIHDSETAVYLQDVPHVMSEAEMVALLDHNDAGPPPAGYTQIDYSYVKAILTGYVDPITNEAHALVTIREHITDIEEVTILINGVVELVATRSGGGALFDDRGVYTYVTLSLSLHPGQVQSGEIQWRDAQQNHQGTHAFSF